MEDKSNEVVATGESTTHDDKITRKEALIKAGKYAAITALGTMIILSPKKSQADSPEKLGHGTGW
jgi:hypothetical protein